MNLSLGMIVRYFDSSSSIIEFLKNAEKYGHTVTNVIVAYSHRYDPAPVHEIEQYVPVHLVPINHNHNATAWFKEHGILNKYADELLYCKPLEKSGFTPYGFNRNTVVIEAMIRKSDVLVFVDSDVHPYVLKKDNQGEIVQEDIDFFGAHLNGLVEGSVITTSDYSGYNILPPAMFDGMDDLLYALQKDSMVPYWTSCDTHRCLSVQTNFPAKPFATTKVLGGNMAIDLHAFKKLDPFFSPHYFMNETMYLGRGEDTLLGVGAADYGWNCLDVDMHVFHNTYGNYPTVPDVQKNIHVQQRFFNACMGWIGRNPFLNWIRGRDVKRIRAEQFAHLQKSVPHLVNYTGNTMFAALLKAFDISYDSLPYAIEQYQRTKEAWLAFTAEV